MEKQSPRQARVLQSWNSRAYVASGSIEGLAGAVPGAQGLLRAATLGLCKVGRPIGPATAADASEIAIGSQPRRERRLLA
jgi:hypothetical protein